MCSGWARDPRLVRWAPIEVGRTRRSCRSRRTTGAGCGSPTATNTPSALFFRSLDDQTIRWLTAFDRRREQLAERDALVFAVTHRTERLRAFRAEIGVGFPLRPLALAASVPVLGPRVSRRSSS
jgi:hypothetical protein